MYRCQWGLDGVSGWGAWGECVWADRRVSAWMGCAWGECVCVEAFVAEVKSYKIGNPAEENVYIGALTRKEHPRFLAGQVNDAVSKGARLLCGGKPISAVPIRCVPSE